MKKEGKDMYEKNNQEKVSAITEISTKQLCEYSDKQIMRLSGRPQPFLEYSPESLDKLILSISDHGIIEPITVRAKANGKYEILSGRNRYRAAKKIGLRTVPAIVRENISDDEAALIMLESNLRQRQGLKYSEKAYAYRMEMEILNRQGKRTDLDLTSCTGCTKLDSLSNAAQKNNESRRTVAYLIRLTYLLPGLLELVDCEKLPFKAGAELSYLPVDAQSYILKNIAGRYKINLSQAQRLKKLNKDGKLTEEAITAVFSEDAKKSESEVKFTVSKKLFTRCPELLNDNSKLQMLFLEFIKEYIERQAS